MVCAVLATPTEGETATPARRSGSGRGSSQPAPRSGPAQPAAVRVGILTWILTRFSYCPSVRFILRSVPTCFVARPTSGDAAALSCRDHTAPAPGQAQAGGRQHRRHREQGGEEASSG